MLQIAHVDEADADALPVVGGGANRVFVSVRPSYLIDKWTLSSGY